MVFFSFKKNKQKGKKFHDDGFKNFFLIYSHTKTKDRICAKLRRNDISKEHIHSVIFDIYTVILK